MFKSLTSSYFFLACVFVGLSFGVNAHPSIATSTDPTPAFDSPYSSNLTTVRLQLNWKHQFEFAGFYAALEKGFYKEAGLDVRIQEWRPNLDVSQAILENQADIGIGYSNILIDYAKGQPLQLLFPVFQVSPAVLISHKPIERLEQLDGMRLTHANGVYTLEMLKKRAQVEAGAKLNFTQASGDIEDFIDKKVDLYTAYAINEPFELQQRQVKYSIVDPKTFGIQSYGDYVFTSRKFAFSNPEELEAFKRASIKGWEYALQHTPEIIDVILNNYPIQKSPEALQAEAEQIERFVRPAGAKVGDLDINKLEAFLRDAKNLGYISVEQFEKLNLQQMIFDPRLADFTKDEQNYLSRFNSLSVSFSPNVQPYSFLDASGQWQGVCHDYLKSMTGYLGLRLVTHQKDWSHLHPEILEGNLDHPISCVIADRSLNHRLLFTDPLMTMHLALATDKNVGPVKNFDDVMGLTLATVSNHGLHTLLRHYYPEMELQVFETMALAISAVKSNRADGIIAGFSTLNDAIQRNGVQGIRVVGNLDTSLPVSIGVPRSQPVLYSVLQKALVLMPELDKKEIQHRWLQAKGVKQVGDNLNSEFLLPAIGLIILLMLIIVGFVFQRRMQKRYLTQVYELSNAAFIDLESQTFMWVSNRFSQLLGRSKDEIIGYGCTKFFIPLHAEMPEVVYEQLRQGQEWQGEIIVKRSGGGKLWLKIKLTPESDWLGRRTKALMTSVDISDQKRIEELLVRDELTWLYNRRFYNEVIDQHLAQTIQADKGVMFVLVDIDFFKRVNDDYGHLYGDKALVGVAKVLKTMFDRSEDLVFRMGGEEFLIVASCDSAKDLEANLEDLRQAVADLKIENARGIDGVVTISMGACCVQSSELRSLDADAIFKEVDELLYRAKDHGRNRVEVKKRGIEALSQRKIFKN
ncbi:diguanylate cyclase [Thiomicrorhabdus indica]|uniref:diguanylate cyclase n=1 Tax=Thiomicrorhabdus indica TaxID=2267253 RepID=UPI00102DB41B|nr:diguanylate cyclase [Thiomicrorhabdus indica]